MIIVLIYNILQIFLSVSSHNSNKNRVSYTAQTKTQEWKTKSDDEKLEKKEIKTQNKQKKSNKLRIISYPKFTDFIPQIDISISDIKIFSISPNQS